MALPPQSLLEVKDLRKHFPIGGSLLGTNPRTVRAVDSVSFSIRPGQTLALVGESGCGKTTVGRIIARLLEASGGTMRLEGEDITHAKGTALRRFRPNVQMIFQDPYTSLNPRLTVGQIVGEPLRINGWSQPLLRERVAELLDAVGISSQQARRLPHELSGGQRQRIAIARALALRPKLIVCDEPVSALDMSIQARILNLLAELQERYQLTYLFISHDLSVVRLIADHIAVMYLGEIVEAGPVEMVFAEPAHPYTKALLAAIPDPHDRRGMAVLAGEVPSNVDPPAGCRFHTRCPERLPVCSQRAPARIEVVASHHVVCFLHHELPESDEKDTAGKEETAN